VTFTERYFFLSLSLSLSISLSLSSLIMTFGQYETSARIYWSE
jgi:hypothetical protein